MANLIVDCRIPLRSFDLELNFEVGRETLALVGPSGAGKTMTLRSIAGLKRPARGRILCDAAWFDSEQRIDLPPEERSVGMVFQDYALFPHMTVRENLRFAGTGRAGELLERLRIEHLANELPANLSGGERQRAAVARALARDPQVVLLDEPMAALDAETRAIVRAELRDILRETGLPTVLVTHDYEDAATLGDRIGVIVDGKIMQTGSAAELVARPAGSFVARFVGANVLAGRAEAGPSGLTKVTLEDGRIVFSTDAAGGRVGVVVYPWEILLAREDPHDSALNRIRGEVTSVVTLGSRVRVRVGMLAAELTTASAEALGIEVGRVVVASFKATGTRLVPLGRSVSGG